MYGVSIWTRAEPNERSPRHTREAIAAAAVAVADADGLSAVTMRRVAAELGAGTMSLYHYVRTKDDLVTLMDDAVMREVVLDAVPAGWREALTAIAGRMLDVYERHPWVVWLRGADPGPSRARHVEQILGAVASLPVDGLTRFEIVSLVDDYVTGFVLRHGGSDAGDVDAIPDEVFALMETSLASLPHTAAIVGEDVRAFARHFIALAGDRGRFERGLARVLDGIAISVGEQPAGGRRPRS
jgi:AcrR family transcriptional regulator